MAIKIGFDAKRAFHNKTGLGVYSRHLIEAIQKQISAENIILFSPKKKIWNSPINTITSNLGAFWRSFLVYFDIKKSGIDVYHGLAGELPFWLPKGLKTVVTIHDLLFERFPKDYSWIDRKIYSIKAKYACQRADKIIAVSEVTKTDIIDFYNIDKNKIDVIPVGIDIEINDYPQSPHPREYILCISSFIGRKNQALLVQAFDKITSETNTDLIFIGSGSTKEHIRLLAAKTNHSDRIIFLSNISDDKKFEYLSHAKFSIYPSKYEGFGIPILESFAYQIPIILSNTAVHKEVASEAGIYFENDDLESLEEVIITANNLDPDTRSNHIQKGQKRLESFESEYVYKDLGHLYKKLTSESS